MFGVYNYNSYNGQSEPGARPDMTDSPYQTSQVEIPMLDLPLERVKLSTITMEDIAPDNIPIFINRCYSPYPVGDTVDEALLEYPDPEDLSPYFTAEELDQIVPSGALWLMAKAFDTDKDVKWMARRMALDGPVISSVSDRHRDNLQEWAYEFLQVWKRIHGTGATTRELLRALSHTDYQTHCWILKDYLVKERKGELPAEEESSKDKKEGGDKDDREKDANGGSTQQRGFLGWGRRY